MEHQNEIKCCVWGEGGVVNSTESAFNTVKLIYTHTNVNKTFYFTSNSYTKNKKLAILR